MVLHREFQNLVTFGTVGGRNKSNLLRVPSSVVACLTLLHDKKQDYGEYSLWGLYDDTVTGHFLSPYDFSKEARKKLAKFTDTFLEKMGFENFLQEKPTDDFTKNLLRLKTNSLGFKE